MVRPWAIYVYFPIKRYGHPLITRGQCTIGESQTPFLCFLNHHVTMVLDEITIWSFPLPWAPGRRGFTKSWSSIGRKLGYPGYPQGKPRSAALGQGPQVPRDPTLIHRRRPHRSRWSCAVGPLLQRLRSHTTRRRQRLKWAPACGQMWRFQREKWGWYGDITMAGKSHGSFDGKMISQ